MFIVAAMLYIAEGREPTSKNYPVAARVENITRVDAQKRKKSKNKYK